MRRATESVNAATRNIDRCSTLEMLQLINAEDRKCADAVNAVLPEIAKAADAVAESMKRGGRLIYIGAGTSGRLGVMDAVECLPTYGIAPDKIFGIIAGGAAAMCRAREQEEDKAEYGRDEMIRLEVNANDTIIGLSASGSTPFVSGALAEAKQRGAVTAAVICNNAGTNLDHADIKICLITGPEAICGSTRMKAATAQKMTLNMISTAAMVRYGRVIGNHMVEIKARNVKLRDRACFILNDICGIPEEEGRVLLEESNWDLRGVIEKYRK